MTTTWLVTRVYFDKPVMQPDVDQLGRNQNQVVLSFIKPHKESIDRSRVTTWHFFREQEGTPENPGRPYLLMRICGERDYLCNSLKPALENDLRGSHGRYGVIDHEVNEEPNYTEEGGYGKDGWPIAQKVFEYTAEASLLLLDYRSRNAALPNDFSEDKLVHCFLNQSHWGYDKEIDFYVKRLRDLGVNVETR